MMWLVLGQSMMVISTTSILLYAKVYPFFNVLWECIVVVYEHFVRLLHVGSSDLTYYLLQFLRFKLKNENDKMF